MVSIFGPKVSSAAPKRMNVQPETGDLLELTVCGPSATFEFDISTGSSTLIELPRGIESYAHLPDTPYGIERNGNKLHLIAPQNTPENDEFSLRIFATDGTGSIAFETTLHTRAVNRVMGVRDNVVIYHQSDKQRYGAHSWDNPCRSQEDTSTRRLRIRAETRHQNAEKTTRGLPVIDHVAKSGESLDVSILLAEWDQDDMVIDFEARNPWFQPSMLTDIRARDSNGNAVKLEPIIFEEDSRETQNGLVTIRGRERTVGSVLLPNALSRDLESMELSFHGFKGGVEYATAVKVVRFRPVTPEDDALDARKQRARQVALSARIAGGSMWFSDGADLGLASSALSSGFGVRMVKGISPLWAFEAEIMGGATRDVTFDSVSWDGATGDIQRDARFGRVVLGAQLRFGDWYQPHARFGLGLQGGRHSSRFVPESGDERDGPDSGLAMALIWSVGAGITIRFHAHWTLGFELSGIGMAQNLSSDTLRGALEGGFYVGYGWNP